MNSPIKEPINLLLRGRDRSELARFPRPNPENWIQPWWDCSVNRLGGPPNPLMRSATNNMPLWDGNPQEKSPARRSKWLCKHTLLIHQVWEQVKWWDVEIFRVADILAHTTTHETMKITERINHEVEMLLGSLKSAGDRSAVAWLKNNKVTDARRRKRKQKHSLSCVTLNY